MRLFITAIAFSLVACSAAPADDSATGGVADTGDAQTSGDTGTADTGTDTGSDTGSDTSEDVDTDSGDPDTSVDTGEPEIECPDTLPDATDAVLGEVRESIGPGRHHAAHCGVIVWASPGGGLRLHDLVTRVTLMLIADGADVRWPDVHEDVIVFTDGDPPQVIMRTDQTNSKLEPTGKPQLRPRISKRWIAWEDERDGVAQIRLVDRKTGIPKWADKSQADQRFVALSGDLVVWTDFRDEDLDGVFNGDGSDLADIYGIVGGTAKPLVAEKGKQAFADVDGDRIIWLDWREWPLDQEGQPRPQPKLQAFEVYRGTIAQWEVAGAEPFGKVNQGSYSGLPTIAGSWVAWVSGKNGLRVFGNKWDAEQIPWRDHLLSPEDVDATVPLLLPDRLTFQAADQLHVSPLP